MPFLPMLIAFGMASVGAPDPLINRCLIPDIKPGKAKLEVHDKSYVLSNDVLAVTWTIGAEGDTAPAIESGFAETKFSDGILPIGFPFEVTTTDHRHIWPFGMKLVGEPKLEKIKGSPNSESIAGRCDGQRLNANFVDAKQHARVKWSATLLDYSNYVRQDFNFESTEGVLPLDALTMLRSDLSGAAVRSHAICTETTFFGIERLGAECKVTADLATSYLVAGQNLKLGQTFSISTVFGAAPKGQMRRGILNYVVRERSPSQLPDVSPFATKDEDACIKAVTSAHSGDIDRWRIENAEALLDAHPIGVDQNSKRGIYGWASLGQKSSLLVLVNSAEEPKGLALDIKLALELPEGFRGSFDARNPWASDPKVKPLRLTAGKPFTCELKAGEVVVYELRKR